MTKLYLVKKGDTLCSIAKKFKTTCKKLIELNNLTNITYIQENDLILIERGKE